MDSRKEDDKDLQSSVEKQPRHARTVRRGGQRRGAGAVVSSPRKKQPRSFVPRALPRWWATSSCSAGVQVVIPDRSLTRRFPMMLDITVQLNTNITNEISDERVVKARSSRAEAPSYQEWRNYVGWPMTSPGEFDASKQHQILLAEACSGTVNSRTTATLSSGRKSLLSDDQFDPCATRRWRGGF